MTRPTIHHILASIPNRFRAEKALDYETVFHFHFQSDGQHTVTIHQGVCTVANGLVGKPKCVVTTTANDYVALELGELNAHEAVLSGRVSVSDIAEMMRFAKCFRTYPMHTTAAPPTKERPALQGPLAGYKVLDFTKLLPGPLATLWLAQQGAEVIKVEDPASPDPIRDYPPLHDGVSVYYAALNAGKRSLAIDFRSVEGRQIIYRMVQQVDVVIEQYRPGVMAAFGLDYASLKQINPKIIFVSITGYGQTGPMAHFPGHDINYLSYAGVLDSLRNADGTPIIPTAQIADIAGGSMMALNAVTTALLHRERTGLGQHADVPMVSALPYLNALRWTEEQTTGQFKARLSGRLACYNIYICADERHVALGALEPKFWQRFCQLVDHPEWAARIIDEDQTPLIDEVAHLFKSQPLLFWTDRLEAAEVCLSPVLTLQESANHPLFQQTGFMGSLANAHLWPAPALGEDNALLLSAAELPA